MEKKARILVAEDEYYLREILCSALKNQGFDVVEAEDGFLALQRLGLEKFDLVISDVKMPRKSGIELLQWAKKNSGPPVILMTGFAEILETKEAHELGVKGFLPKPFQMADLAKAIETALPPPPPVPDPEHAPPQPGASIDGRRLSDDDFCKLNINEFVSGKDIQYDIYVRIRNDEYILIAHNGEDLNANRIQLYKDKGLAHLYLRKEDFRKYLGMTQEIMTALSGTAKIEKTRKIGFLKHAAEVAIESLFQNDIDHELMQCTSDVVKSTVELLSDEQDLLNMLHSLAQNPDYVYTHSVAVSSFATLIARKMGWKSPALLFKVSTAGLLHDIGKKELPVEIIMATRASLDASKIAMLETHTNRGAEILSSLQNMPAEIVQIVQQHHENCSGTGYPLGLRKDRIHPVARIVAVADEFCYLALATPNSKGKPAAEAAKQLVGLYAGQLDTDAILALHKVLKLPPPEELMRKKNRKFS